MELNVSLAYENELKADLTIATNNSETLPFQDKTIIPSVEKQVVKADEGYRALNSVTVEEVTNDIDSNIKAENIKKGVSILDVEGNFDNYDEGYSEGYGRGYDEGYEKGYADNESVLQDKTVAPLITQQTVQADEGYDALSSVIVKAVTSSIDENIAPENIKKDIEILGVTGSFEGGGDSYYDTFWDNYQQNGARKVYNTSAFAQAFWNDNNFKPKYNMQPTNVVGMFQSCKITNLKQILEDCGVVLDTSKCTTFNIWLQSSNITHLPCISLEGLAVGGDTIQIFTSAHALKYIEKITTRADIVWHTNAFLGCTRLETIAEIEGEIGKTLVMSACSKIDLATAKRILLALTNYAGTENEGVNQITFHSNVWVLLDADGNTAPDGTAWRAYITTKGWLY